MYGAYPSLLVGVVAALAASVLGFVVGALAGYYGKLEIILSGSSDIVMSLPALPLLILVATLFVVYKPADHFASGTSLVGAGREGDSGLRSLP